MRPEIERRVDAILRRGVEQARLDRILPHGVHGLLREPVDGEPPGRPAVARYVDVGADIVEPETVDGNERGVVVEVRGIDLRALAPRRQPRRRNLFPVSLPRAYRRTVTGDPYVTVVRSGPDGSRMRVRWCEGVDDAAMVS